MQSRAAAPRRSFVSRACALTLTALFAPRAGAEPAGLAPPKVLRCALRVAGTGFDPAQIASLYWGTMAASAR